MHSPHFISVYAFAVVFIFLGGIFLLLRIVVRLFGSNRSSRRHESPPPFPDSRPRQTPFFVPPPPPRTEHEYWQAEHYCFDHQQPAPLPPPRNEREDW